MADRRKDLADLYRATRRQHGGAVARMMWRRVKEANRILAGWVSEKIYRNHG